MLESLSVCINWINPLPNARILLLNVKLVRLYLHIVPLAAR